MFSTRGGSETTFFFKSLRLLCSCFHRSGEEHQPGQNTEPEALRSRLSRTRQVFKLPAGLREPPA